MSGLTDAQAIVRRHFMAEDFLIVTGHELPRERIVEIDEAAVVGERETGIPYEETALWLLGVIADQVREQQH